ncbi:MAG: hypothetical protein NT126_08610 [Bacteroidetes bacterium]|nr:hypothetical protein [Bacteroidota bacterium]
MENSKDWTDALLYFVPALLVSGAMLLVVKRFLDRDHQARLIEAKRSMQKESLPLKLQAYERLVLFLERISPNSLLVRTHRAGVSASQLHADLLATIRAEFEHNLSQQIYISSAAWEAVKNSKEDTLRLINSAYETAGQNANGIQLSSSIFELVMKEESIPSQMAIDVLKREVKQLLG